MTWIHRIGSLAQRPASSLRKAVRQSQRRCRVETLEARQYLAANPLITEFVADNSSGLLDGSVPPQQQDWIELYNDGDQPLDLAGWHLTDNPGNAAKWTFPSRTLAPGSFLVVFASGNGVPDPAGNLHTNFRLAADGEYIALTRPDLTVASEFGPNSENYPRQRTNISYGVDQPRTVSSLVPRDTLGKFRAQSTDGGLGTSWTGGSEPFNDATWSDVLTGVGYKTPGTPPGGSTTAVFDPSTGHYMQLVSTAMTWTNARANAQTLSLGGVAGHLATIGSAAENAFALARAGGGGPWIGAHDSTTEGSWEWVDAPGQAFCIGVGSCNSQNGAYTNWNGGEPNDVNGEDYAQIISTGAWNDLPNTSSLASIVEFDTVPTGYFTVRQVKSASGVFADIDAALALLAGGANSGDVTAKFAGIDLIDTGFGAAGHYVGNAPFPINTTGDDDAFAVRVTGTIEIPTAGAWTFGMFHDDNARFILRGDNGFQLLRDSAGCCGDDFIATTIPAAGFYDLEVVYYENTGGAQLELFAAAGTHTAFNTNFKQLGDVRNGGLALSTFGNLFSTDVRTSMQNVNASALLRVPFTVAAGSSYDALTLRMSYDDGFVAYLNGTEIARRNAPASVAWNSAATAARNDEAVGVAEEINVSAFLNLLQPGTNILAVQGLNVSAADGDFLILPELDAISAAVGGSRYFLTPTPGAFNALGGVVDFVDDIRLSQPHGFYDAPFQLALLTNTPGATIRYTTNGELPTATTGSIYNAPLTIGATSVVRAGAFKAGFQPSPVETATYLFLDDVITQSANGTAPPGWPATWGANQVNYGMDPDVVGPNDTFGGLYRNTIKDDLKSIPAWSVVMKLDDLFGTQGIYANPGGEGRAWERPASIEVIDALGRESGVQSNAGIRIRGGFSRTTGNPKHAFRFFFREDYGDAKLRYPLFQEEGVDEFDSVDLRTAQNYSWAFQNDARNVMNRDVWSRDTQRDMGDPYTRSRYYHLFINGQYWGLYQTQERSEAAYAASYFGGQKEDYDVVKAEAGPYRTVATDGNLNAAAAFYDLFSTQFNPANAAQKYALYLRMQGLNPDGTPNPLYPKYLDVDNTIDYMLVIYFNGNSDGPILGGGGGTNNFFSIFNRVNPDGFKWFAHDNEHTLDTGSGDRTGPFNNIGTFDMFNPQYLFQQLSAVPEFRLRVADRLHKFYHNGGALTTAETTARFLDRKNEIDRAIVGESARWGDAQRATPYTRNVEWVNAINNLTNYFNNRSATAFNQMVADGLYSTVETTDYYINGQRQFGGSVPLGAEFSLTLGQGQANYNDTTLLPATSQVRTFVPTDGTLGTTWTAENFTVPATWTNGTYGVGYETSTGYETLINTNVQAAMSGLRTGVYMRSQFNVGAGFDYDRLLLRMKYDDGFVAYLNGVPVATALAPASPVWNSAATANHDDGAAVQFQDFDITPFMNLLHAGTNTLAIHGMNVNTTSSDLIFIPELVGGVLIPGGTNKPVYYTLDGSDPRRIDGTISPTATLYQNPFNLNQSTIVNARAFDNGTWGPITETTYTVQMPIRVTEINYNPQPFGPPTLLADDFEFVEIQNTSATPVSLTNLQFIDGLQFNFATSAIQTLAPGARAVVVKNLARFQSLYGNTLPVAGVFTGSLANEGEVITLADSLGGIVQTFTYNDAWYDITDGHGYTLAIRDPNGDLDLWNNAAGWQPSYFRYGSPGTGETGTPPAEDVLVINEIQNNPAAGGDRLEIFNTSTTATVDISGWYLSDNELEPTRHRLGSVPAIPPGGYLVLDETTSFGATFSLNPAGGTILLQASDALGNPIGFQARETYDAADVGMVHGRYVKADGDVDFVPLTAATLGAGNAAPIIGPIVINELLYNPPAGQVEFIELKNISNAPVNLNNWWFSTGVNFTFGAITVPAGGYVIVSENDPATFLATHTVPPGVQVVGPFVLTSLDNAGDDVRLRRPGPSGGYILVDRVNYKDVAPWPSSPDGQGPTLARVNSTTYGNIATNWGAGIPGGTIGTTNTFYDETPPTIPTGLAWTPQAGPRISLSWNASSDPESGVREYSVVRGGVEIGVTTGTTFVDTTAATNTAYSYQIVARNNSLASSGPSAVLAAKILDIVSVTKVSATQVRVTFTEAVQAASAQTLANYYLGGVAITQAVVEATPTSVLLTTAALVDGQPYRLAVSNVVSSSANVARLIPDTQRIFTPGVSNGLLGTYHDDLGPAPDYTFQGTSVQRVDATILFTWIVAPHPSIGQDTFGVQWLGKIEPEFTENYTVHYTVEDGGRMWIDLNNDGTFAANEKILDRWVGNTTGTISAVVPLTGGQRYNVKIEMFDLTSIARARLEWESARQVRQNVPTTRLFTPISSESVAPTVNSVRVLGSEWTPAFTSAVQAAGLGTGGVAVAPGGTSPILPWTNVDRIVMTFTEDMDLTASDLVVTGVNNASYPVTGLTYDFRTFTATWTLAQPLPADRVTVQLAPGATDLAGNSIGGANSVVVRMLPGDVNQSGGVDNADFQANRAAQFTSLGGAGYTVLHDVNSSGAINIADWQSVFTRRGTALPPGSPAAASAIDVAHASAESTSVTGPKLASTASRRRVEPTREIPAAAADQVLTQPTELHTLRRITARRRPVA